MNLPNNTKDQITRDHEEAVELLKRILDSEHVPDEIKNALIVRCPELLEDEKGVANVPV